MTDYYKSESLDETIAIWEDFLSEDEVQTLATGVCPTLVKPDSLVFYAPLNDLAYAKALLEANHG